MTITTKQEALKRLKAISFLLQLKGESLELEAESAKLKGEFGIDDLEALSYLPGLTEDTTLSNQAELREYEQATSSVVLTENKALRGLELKFPVSPGKEVTTTLSQAGWRYHGGKRIWYTRESEEARQFALSFTGGAI